MAYGPNRLGLQTRASAQTAGGSIIKYRHPFLAGAIDTDTTGTAIDEIDVSSCLKLAGTFFSAKPSQDSSKQEVLVDGSIVTITNHLLAGVAEIPVISTTGLVASGDLVAALQLVVACKDSVLGMLTRTKYVNGKALTRVYYGVSVKNVPHDVMEGMDVPVYLCQLYYAGFIDSISEASDLNLKAIWAVGSKSGVKGIYKPYELNVNGSTHKSPLSATNALGIGNVADDTTTALNLNTADATEESLSGTGYRYIDSAIQPNTAP